MWTDEDRAACDRTLTYKYENMGLENSPFATVTVKTHR